MKTSTYSTNEKPKEHYRIAVKFGNPILDAGHTAIPNLILRHYAQLKITPQAMMFVIHLLEFKWDRRDPFPSIDTVAKRMGLSVRQIQRYEAALIQRRCLKVSPRYSRELGQMTNEYNFTGLVDQILRHLEPDERPLEASPNNPSGTPPSPTPLTPVSPPPLTSMSPEEDTAQTDSTFDQIDSKHVKKGRTAAPAATPPRQQRPLAQPTSTPLSQNRITLVQAFDTQATAVHPIAVQTSIRSMKGKRRKRSEGGTALDQDDKRGGGFKSLTDLLNQRLVFPASLLPPAPPETPVRGRKGSSRAERGERAQMATGKTTLHSGAAQGLRATAQIADVVKTISQEFGDTRIGANVSQIGGLFARSGLDQAGFIDWLYVVRAEVREKRFSIKNPMAYFYTTLRNRLKVKR